MHIINLRVVYALLVVLETGNVAHKTDLLMKASVEYGKCIGVNTLNPYYKLFEKKGFMVVGNDKLILSAKGKALYKNIKLVADTLGLEDEE